MADTTEEAKREENRTEPHTFTPPSKKDGEVTQAKKKPFMENKEFEIKIKTSDLSLEEKRDLLWECFDILLSEKDSPSGDNSYQLDLNPPSGILVVDDRKSEDNKITKDSE